MKEKNHKKILRIGTWALFGVYIILLIYFLFFAESTGRTAGDGTYHYNLVLLKEIKRFITYRHTVGWPAVLLNLVGNVVAFAPFGFLLPILNERCKGVFIILLYTLEFSLAMEVIQLICKVGSFDVDDLLLNTIGGILGYLMYLVLGKWTHERKTQKK